MSNRRTVLISVATLACVLFASAAFSAPAAAANVTIHLWGNSTGGWGDSNTTIKSPGPSLTVTLGDNVTLVLNGTDGRGHNFFIDYNNDSAVSAGEPVSPTFRNVAVTWNFTASKNGTFIYRSSFGRDLAQMWGNITVRPQGASGGPALIAGNTVLLVAAIVVAFVAILAVAAFVARRKRMTPPPPESEADEPTPESR